MDIDEFLDRELSDLGLQTEKTEQQDIELPGFQGQFDSSLFENIKDNLSKGDLEGAEQAYIQLWGILLQQKLKWNKELYEQLSVLSRQFLRALNYSYEELKKKSARIDELIGRARAAIKEGRKELPFKIYSEIQEISNSIPNVFFEEKKSIEEQIAEFYKELKSTTDNELLKRVSALLQEINQLIARIDMLIRSNDMTSAIVHYNKCLELYHQVPEGFLRHKNTLGMRLLEIYKSLSIHNEISNLQRQLTQQPQLQQTQVQATQSPAPSLMMLSAKKERAKRNIEKGFYNEAFKNIQEALNIEPNDAEARALHAKIKTLQ